MAIHQDVETELEVWAKDDRREFAKRVMGLMVDLAGDEPAIRMRLKQLSAEKIQGSHHVLELGPKQRQGGAPRVMFMRHRHVAAFLAAGMEHGSGGAANLIKAAKRREKDVVDALKDNLTVEQLSQALPAYQITAL